MSTERDHTPKSDPAEEGILSAMVENIDSVWQRFGPRLRDELFWHPARRTITHAIIDLHVSGHPVDIVTITTELRKTGKLDSVGGASGISALLPVTFSPTYAVDHYLAELEDMAARRRMLLQADAMRAAAFDYTQPWRTQLEATEQSLFELHAQTSHSGMIPIGRLVPDVMTQLDAAMNSRGHVTKGIATGMTSLDRMTMGLEPGLFILGARPSKGKTAAMMQIALNIGLGQGDYEEYRQPPLDVGIFSLETGDINLARRALLNLAAVNMRRIADGLLSYNERDAITREAKRLMTAKIHIEASYGLSIQDLRARARMLVKNLGLKILMVDYLQLLTSTSKKATQSRQIEVAECSVGLKHLAHELQIPIIALAQLNRDADVARPRASQIRDCGQIEQDADYIALICEPPEHISQNDPEDCPWTYLGLDLVKNKDGGTTNGVDPLAQRFDKEFFRLTSLERKLLSNDDEHRQKNYQPREKSNFDRPQRPRGRPRKDGSTGNLNNVFPED
jgi:replicative DNA helicase